MIGPRVVAVLRNMCVVNQPNRGCVGCLCCFGHLVRRTQGGAPATGATRGGCGPNDRIADMTDQDLTSVVQRMADKIAQIDARLDFSETSLAVVEEKLEEASGFLDEMSADAVDRIAQQFGSYVLEVARRALGGVYQWYADRNAPVLVIGEPSFRVAMLTWDKTRGRLGGDEADNIPFFYAGVADRVRSATPGVDALYV